MSSNELLEANVVSIRKDLTDLRADFREAIARIDRDIRAMAADAKSETKEAVARFDEQFRELRAECRSLRDKVDKNHGEMHAGFAAVNKSIADVQTK